MGYGPDKKATHPSFSSIRYTTPTWATVQTKRQRIRASAASVTQPLQGLRSRQKGNASELQQHPLHNPCRGWKRGDLFPKLLACDSTTIFHHSRGGRWHGRS